MITGDLKNKIDKIWETFWTGGITNPLDVIEQFTYLLFIMLEYLSLSQMKKLQEVMLRELGSNREETEKLAMQW